MDPRTLWPRPLVLCCLAFTFAMTVWASGPSYGLMIAVAGEVGEEKTAGGNAKVCRYARLAVKTGGQRHGMVVVQHIDGSDASHTTPLSPTKHEKLTDCSVCEDDE